MERHQVWLYLAALAVGLLLGLGWPGLAGGAEVAVTPVLGVLLYLTFLAVPFRRIGEAARDVRFLTAVVVLNFVVVPVVVWVISRAVAHDQALLLGVLFVLLCPCVDYVIVFTGLAGGAQDRLLAASPLLMVAQILMLPLYLSVMAEAEIVRSLDLAPFAEAFVVLIILPLAAAVATQLLAARFQWAAAVESRLGAAMVPWMMLTLAVVVVSQVVGVRHEVAALAPAVPVYLLFAVVMVPLGMLAARVARLDVPGTRAVVFSGVTRNSLVVLPLVLALPVGFELAPLAVVTQTLVELLLMVVMMQLVPRAIPGGTESSLNV